MIPISIVLSLLSLSFSQLLPSDEDIAQMSSFEKQILYKFEKKKLWKAYLYNSLLPSSGWSYIDNYQKGIKFKLYQSIPLLGFIYYNNVIYRNAKISNPRPDPMPTHPQVYADLAWTAVGVLMLWESIELKNDTDKYNQRLHNKIFGKKDKNLSFLILPISDCAYLNLSYKF